MAGPHEASQPLIEPLISTDLAMEDSPAIHNGRAFADTSPNNLERQHQMCSSGTPTPPRSVSPRQTSFPVFNEECMHQSSLPSPPHPESTALMRPPTTQMSNNDSRNRNRGSSTNALTLGGGFTRPLDIIRAEHRAANRVRRRTHVGADSIDRLGNVDVNGLNYHHEGPYDATLLARNLNYKSSPVAAVKGTNNEAIRATPPEFINDSINQHIPLAGTATVPSGVEDCLGRVLNYREGPNLDIEMGWRRWEGLAYRPDNAGDNSSLLPRSVRTSKNHNIHRRVISESAIELYDRPSPPGYVSSTLSVRKPECTSVMTGKKNVKLTNSISEVMVPDNASDLGNLQRAHTTGKRSTTPGGALRSRFGSLRRREPTAEPPM